MEKLSSTAKKLDSLFRIAGIFITIGIVSCIVGLAILAVGYFLKLELEMIGNNWNSLDLGFLELQVAESYVPSREVLLLQAAMEVVYTLLCLFFGHLSVKCIRNILQPMTVGQPFHSTVSINLRKLARYCIALGITGFLVEVLTRITTTIAFRLHELLLGEAITHVSYNYTFDLTFLLVAAVLYLLSYIFRYGEQLQQLSDETL